MLRLEDNEELFKSVAKELAKTKKKYNYYIKEGQIDDVELEKVTKLKITCNILQGIEKLSKLKKLDIRYNPQGDSEKYEETIGRLENLTSLRMIGNHDTDIDLKNNSNLTDILIAGENCKVRGVEKLECLNNKKRKLSFYMSGNSKIENMEAIISRCSKKNTKRLVLPHLTFAQEKSTNPNIIQALTGTNANVFFQTHGANDYMTKSETIEIDKEITKIKEELQLLKRDKEGKIIKTYEYICENFTYAEKEAVVENKGFSSRNDQIRNTRKVLKNKRGVCAAFSNIFNYILQSEGITCLPAHGMCDFERNGGHQLSKVKMDNDEWAYFDPTQGIGFRGNVDWRFFHMSKQRVNSYCKLNDREKRYKSAKDIAWSELKEKIELEELPLFQRSIQETVKNEVDFEIKENTAINERKKDVLGQEK